MTSELLDSLLPNALEDRVAFGVLLDWLRETGEIEADRVIATATVTVADRLAFLCWWLSQDRFLTSDRFLNVPGIEQLTRTGFSSVDGQEHLTGYALTYYSTAWEITCPDRSPSDRHPEDFKTVCHDTKASLYRTLVVYDSSQYLLATPSGWQLLDWHHAPEVSVSWTETVPGPVPMSWVEVETEEWGYAMEIDGEPGFLFHQKPKYLHGRERVQRCRVDEGFLDDEPDRLLTWTPGRGWHRGEN